MIKLNIHFSKEFENYRIENCLKKIDWYKEQGYKLNLPETDVDQEYREEDFLAFSNLIQKNWAIYEKKLHDLLANLKGSEIQETYNLNLTKYGVGGSYSLPNTIIVNISQTNKDIFIPTIIHEIIHLSIEKLITKYKIEHWQKERLVDLISLKFFPDEFKLQRNPKDFEIIQQSLEINYPNIELIIKEIGQDKN